MTRLDSLPLLLRLWGTALSANVVGAALSALVVAGRRQRWNNWYVRAGVPDMSFP